VRQLAATIAVLLCVALPARAQDPGPAAFDKPQPVVIEGYGGHAMEPFLSRDGTMLFFNNLNEPSVNTDIHYAVRTGTLAFRYKGLVGGVNTEKNLEGVPSLDRSGTFYFISPRAYGMHSTTIFTGKFREGSVTDVKQVQGDLSPGKLFWFNMDSEISADGNTLYSTDNRTLPFGKIPDRSDFFIARKTASGTFRRDEASAAIMKNVNAPGMMQYAASISGDELTLYFTRLDRRKLTTGIYVATRPRRDAAFGPPQRIESITGPLVEAPAVTPDGCGIYFHRKGADGIHRIWHVRKSGQACAPRGNRGKNGETEQEGYP
jgi:hypothetical protein